MYNHSKFVLRITQTRQCFYLFAQGNAIIYFVCATWTILIEATAKIYPLNSLNGLHEILITKYPFVIFFLHEWHIGVVENSMKIKIKPHFFWRKLIFGRLQIDVSMGLPKLSLHYKFPLFLSILALCEH